jgi:hypothetical protein
MKQMKILKSLSDFLSDLGVEVLRPSRTPTDYYNFCPRDVIFTHKDLTVVTPMPIEVQKRCMETFN